MFFLLTNFIYPIKKPISLSNHFDFVFDNPRTKEEVKTVKELIQKSWDLSETVEGFQYQRFPMKKDVPNQDVITFEILIEEFLQKYFGKKEAKKKIKNIEGNKDAIIDFYSQHWVIVRYETTEMDKEEQRLRSEVKKIREKGDRGFFLLDNEHIFEKREKNLIDYSHLISLLSAKEEFFGWNFLITKSRYEIVEFSPNIHIMRYILEQALSVKSTNKNDPSAYRFDFETFINIVTPKIKLLDEKLKKKEITEEEILYIGDVLESAQPINNEFSSLVRIVSIIEMILTHQPNFSRFNVEDSITKQFVLKTAIIIHQENPEMNLDELKNKLKEIYTQRSNIVHGNFSAVDNYLKKLKKKDEYFDSLISNAYYFVRIVLDTFIRQPKFVQFLKESH